MGLEKERNYYCQPFMTLFHIVNLITLMGFSYPLDLKLFLPRKT